MPPLRLIFMGTPPPAATVLEALVGAGHDVARVYTRAPARAGRGHRERPSAVHLCAEAHGLEVRTPADLRGAAEVRDFAALGADAAVVAAYGLVLPPPVLAAPRRGCVNIHPSLLPRWRGAAPVERAIAAGDRETGVTIMQMDEGLDTGPVLRAEPVAVAAGATAPELLDELFRLGARLVLEVLADEAVEPRPQGGAGATHAPRIRPEEGRVDWSEPAAAIERKVRAFIRWPGTWFELGGERVKILAADAVPGSGEPGTVVDGALGVACGEGVLRVTRLQRAGRPAMGADEFLRGRPLAPGAALS